MASKPYFVDFEIPSALEEHLGGVLKKLAAERNLHCEPHSERGTRRFRVAFDNLADAEEIVRAFQPAAQSVRVFSESPHELKRFRETNGPEFSVSVTIGGEASHLFQLI